MTHLHCSLSTFLFQDQVVPSSSCISLPKPWSEPLLQRTLVHFSEELYLWTKTNVLLCSFQMKHHYILTGLWRELGNIYIYTRMYIYTYTHMCVCIYIHTHTNSHICIYFNINLYIIYSWKSWFHAATPNSSHSISMSVTPFFNSVKLSFLFPQFVCLFSSSSYIVCSNLIAVLVIAQHLWRGKNEKKNKERDNLTMSFN